jgi:dTDP-4-amino-4,6-dideoxygalactose transaminase
VDADEVPDMRDEPARREAEGFVARRLGRLPPFDGVIEDPAALLDPAPADLAVRLAAALAERTGAKGALLRRSRRDALRVALRAAAAHAGRDEVVLPAYASWSVAAAAAAAGLRVRLVDVDERGAIDPVALALLPLERAACVVVCNPFGVAEPVAPVTTIAGPRGAWIVDDATESFGGAASDGAAGARGALGVVGFGRGEPLQALGGGAVLWHDASLRAADGPAVRPRPRRAGGRARAWNAALRPLAYAALGALPPLRTDLPRFETDFARGPIDGAALVLCAHALARCDAARARREVEALRLAAALRARTGFEPIVPPPGARGAFPRLAVRAPDRARRDAALRALARHGAALLHPAPLDAIPALRARLVARPAVPGARALAERVLTLPVRGLTEARREQVLTTLARLAPA